MIKLKATPKKKNIETLQGDHTYGKKKGDHPYWQKEPYKKPPLRQIMLELKMDTQELEWMGQ